MLIRSLNHFISVSLITLLAQSAFAEDLTSQEADLITKEDIASIQVLAEVCPTLISEKAALKNKTDALIQNLLKDLSKTTTLTQLQQDIEYQVALKEAFQNIKEVDLDEQKSACTDILSIN